MAEVEIILIRHGEAASSWDDDSDPGLSNLGKSQAEAVKENLELPSYHIFDMGLSYKMFVNDGTLDVRLNINNVFDNVYISELRSAIAAGEGTGVLYDGIDTANQGYFGLGRTWNVGLRYNF